MTNLLTNAIRYTPPGGHITLSVTAHDQDVAITVRDDGAGIAAGDLNRVFDMFVQVGEGHHTGLGIGLALVRGLVALHDGTVEAHSEGRGRGAEFRVRLPQVPAPPALVAPQKLPAQTVPPCRVLIVDDNQDAADMLGNVLKSQGHIVQVAYDGVEALRRAAEFGPDVGLLDIGMSPMTGHELAQHLRRDARTADTLLIAITGWGQEDDRQRALAAGFDAHLTKPADPDAVLALMARRGVAAP
jgi:CheY-like chemotaxis protein